MLQIRFPMQGKPAYYENTGTGENCPVAGTPQDCAVIEFLMTEMNNHLTRIEQLEDIQAMLLKHIGVPAEQVDNRPVR